MSKDKAANIKVEINYYTKIQATIYYGILFESNFEGHADGVIGKRELYIHTYKIKYEKTLVSIAIHSQV